MKNIKGSITTVFRRGTALALALTALWVAGRTAELSGAAETLLGMTRGTALAVALVRAQLPGDEAPDTEPGRWPGLVLAQSPQLSDSRELVSARLVQEEEPGDAGGEIKRPGPGLQEPEELPEADAPDEESNVVAQTMRPSAGQSYLRAGDIYIANRAKKEVDAAALASAPLNITLREGPQILIVHTHGSEAYTQSGSDRYEESDPYRTTDCNFNVVRVGEEMVRVFQEHGLSVIHDTNLYDYPAYNGAYNRSKEAVERWLSQYPSIQVILDVHRDALEGEDGTVYKVVSREDGEQAAQVMLVVGTDGTGGYHPLWQENLSFAMRLQRQLLDDYDTLARPMVLRSSNYNQQLSVGSLLVEVGTHGNTLSEAVRGARLFAESVSRVLEWLEAP